MLSVCNTKGPLFYIITVSFINADMFSACLQQTENPKGQVEKLKDKTIHLTEVGGTFS